MSEHVLGFSERKSRSRNYALLKYIMSSKFSDAYKLEASTNPELVYTVLCCVLSISRLGARDRRNFKYER